MKMIKIVSGAGNSHKAIIFNKKEKECMHILSLFVPYGLYIEKIIPFWHVFHCYPMAGCWFCLHFRRKERG